MVTDIKNRIFEQYEIRKSKKQKTAFIEYIESVCAENDIPVKVEKKGINRNIVMGASPEESEMVLGAHYDTCAVMPVPNFLTPKNMLVYLIYQILLVVVILLPGMLVGVAAGVLLDNVAIAPLVYMAVTAAIIILMMVGPANKHTANDNTSGVITVLNIMLSMTPEQRAKTCFVLFDNEELGLLGSTAFAGMHKSTMKDKLMINFDCVSDGDHLFVKLSRKEKKSQQGISLTAALRNACEVSGMKSEIGTGGIYPSDQACFKRGIAVAAFNKSKLCGLYLARIHTRRDTVFIDRNIECITAGVLEFAAEGAAE